MPRQRKSNPSEFAKNLRTLIKLHNLSNKEVAAIGDVSSSTLATWLAGATPSDFSSVQKIADHFDVTTAWILTGKEDKTSGKGSPTVAEALAPAGFLYSGFARITIEKLVPRNEFDKQVESFDKSFTSKNGRKK